jgi:tetratricopeptide (TPR) repeat protein
MAQPPTDATTLYASGLAAMEKRQWGLAIRCFDRALAQSAPCHAELGQSLRRAGMLDAAIAVLQNVESQAASQSLQSALDEKAQIEADDAFDSIPRVLVVTCFDPADELSFRRWHADILKTENLLDIYVINRGAAPLDAERCRWINLPADTAGPAPRMSDARAALLLGCLLAYHERADLLYSPIDRPLAEARLVRLPDLLRFVVNCITQWPAARVESAPAQPAETQSAPPAPPPDPEAARQILIAEPDNIQALRDLSIYARHTDRPDMSIRWLRQAVASAPDRSDLHADLGDAFRHYGRLPDAIAEFQRAMQFDPKDTATVEKLRSTIKEQRRLDTGPPPGDRAPRYLIVTGYFNPPSARQTDAEDFFRLWYDNTLKYAQPHRIYVINAASKPVDYGDCHWINLSHNLGHVFAGMSRRRQLGGWSTSLFIGSMLAYLEGADFVYKEQDCLAFGNYIDRLYTDLGPAGFITGRVNENGPAVGLLGTALMLGKLNFLPEFIARYIGQWPSDVSILPETKMAELAKTERFVQTTMGFDRSRPVDFHQPAFYLQKITSDELSALAQAGLI